MVREKDIGSDRLLAHCLFINQDEAEADADDYELSNRPGGPDHPGEDDDDDLDETKRLNGGDGRDRQVVFAIEDEDEEEKFVTFLFFLLSLRSRYLQEADLIIRACHFHRFSVGSGRIMMIEKGKETG